MAASIQGGPRQWGGTRDDEGHREYAITYLVHCLKSEGPAIVMQTPGLPVPGSIWLFDDDIDIWANCKPGLQLKAMRAPGRDQGPVTQWEVTALFSTRPLKRCQDDVIEDPLLQPPEVSGGFVKYTEEATHDRFDNPVLDSGFEHIRGPQNEWDANRAQVRFSHNMPLLEYDLVASMMDHLNEVPMWGFPVRSIKLSSFDWDEKYFGQCYKYYTRKYVFDIRVREDDFGVIVGDWDRDILDEGTKILIGKWEKATGSGCVVLPIVGVNGELTDATIAVAGAGYPPSRIVPLKLDGGTTKAVVLVNTDAAGVPQDVVRVHLPGEGYVGVPTATVQRGHWCLTYIDNNIVPHPDEPQHFMRVKDTKGENIKVIRDGRGMPISEDEDAGIIHVEKYKEANLLLLGVPMVIF